MSERRCSLRPVGDALVAPLATPVGDPGARVTGIRPLSWALWWPARSAVAVGRRLVDSGRGRRRGLGHQGSPYAVQSVEVAWWSCRRARRRAGDGMSGVRRFASRAVIASVGLVVATSFGACTDGGSPTPPMTVPVSTSSAPTTTAAPTKTAMTDDEAAIAAATQYYEEFNQALKTLDTTSLEGLSAEGCRVCDEDRAKMAGFKSSGRKMLGGQAVLTDVTVETRTASADLIIRGRLDVKPLSIVDATGKTVESYPASSFVQRLWMTRKGDAWRVQAIFS